MGFVKFYLNTSTDSDRKKVSTTKLIFADKILTYLKNEVSEISQDDIIEYIYGEFLEHDIAKPVIVNRNNYSDPKALGRKVKSYVTHDKHERYKAEYSGNQDITSSKDIKVKALIDKIEESQDYGYNLEVKFNEVFNNFKVKQLAIKISKEIAKKGKADTFLFKIYKEHCKSIYENIVKEKTGNEYNDKSVDKYFNELEEYEKAIFKLVYEYLKGRVNKCVDNNKFCDFGTNEDALKETREKTLRKVKQYILEHIIYLGKIKRLGFDDLSVVDLSKEFQIQHAKEELNTEILVLFASVNMFFNEVFEKESYVDFFGENFENNTQIKMYNEYTELLIDLGFVEKKENDYISTEALSTFFQKSYSLRNGIIHNNTSNLEAMFEDPIEEKLLSKLIKAIDNLRPSDIEISKSNNLYAILENKSSVIQEINKLEKKDNNNEKYMPGFSKVYSYINKKLDDDNTYCDLEEDSKKIIKNGIMYVNTILYRKYISYEENIKQIINKAFKNSDTNIAKEYKEVQARASKGDRKAIKRFQNKLIEAYLELIYNDDRFKSIFHFEKIEHRDLIEKINKTKNSFEGSDYILESIKTKICIKSEYQYIIAVLCLLANNKYSSSIKNRVFSTRMWLEILVGNIDVYEELENTLDEIIKVKNLHSGNRMRIIEDLFINNIFELNEDENYNAFKELKEEVKSDNGNNDSEFKVSKYKLFNLLSTSINKEGTLSEKLLNDLLKDELKNQSNLDLTTLEMTLNKKYFIYLKNDIDDKVIINKEIPFDKKAYGKFITNIKEILKKISIIIENTNKSYEKYFYEEKIQNYKNVIDEITKEKKDDYLTIYLQGKDKDLYTYKENAFKNISKSTFNNIWEIYKMEHIDLDVTMLKKDSGGYKKIEESLKVVDSTFSKINEKLKGQDNKYRRYFYNKLEIENVFVQVTGLTKEEFLQAYNEVKTYRSIKDKIEFNDISRVNEYLAEINWKLAMQIFRLERDLHNMIVGYFYIIHNTDITQNCVELKSKAYLKNSTDEMFYSFDNGNLNYSNYKNYENVIKFLGLDIKSELVDKVKTENIRNYFAHFYLVREPFNKSIVSKIKDLDELLSYRKRYQNSTINSVLEVFKGDVELDYDKIKKFNIQKSESAEITTLYKNRKINILGKDSYIDNKKLIDILLTSKIES